MPTVINESHPIARKEYKCSWCGGVIPVGEKYERAFLSYEGYTYEWKNHEACRRVAGSLETLMVAVCASRRLKQAIQEKQLKGI